MAIITGQNRMVPIGQPAFNVLSNICDYFELGTREGMDLWLEGDIVGPEGEFVFNGRLFLPDGRAGTVIDNFPKGPVESGWTTRRSLNHDGYELVDQNNEVIFAFRVDENKLCHVVVNLYRADGVLAAHGGQDSLVTKGISVRIGRNGIRIGSQ